MSRLPRSGKSLRGRSLLDESFDDFHDLLLLSPGQLRDGVKHLARRGFGSPSNSSTVSPSDRGSIDGTSTSESFQARKPGPVTITATVGGTSRSTQVTVLDPCDGSCDQTPPVITKAPEDMVVCVGYNGSLSVPEAQDECGDVSYDYDPEDASELPLGTNSVKCTVSDPSGNESECYFQVIVCEQSDWKNDSSIQGEFSMPSSVKDRVNRLLHALPGLGGISVDEFKVGAEGKVRDCCQDDVFLANGEKQVSGNITLSAKMKEIPLWATPTLSYSMDFGVAFVSVDFQAGVYFDSDFSISGMAGTRWGCETCGFGGINGEVTVALRSTIEAILCEETVWTDKHCGGITITPVQIAAKFGGSLGYNIEQCNGNWSGNLTIEEITYSAIFSLGLPGSKSFTYQYKIFNGYSSD